MSGSKTSFARMAIALILVTAVSSVSLGFIYAWTKGPIERVRLEKQLRAIEAVTGAYDNDPVAELLEVQSADEVLLAYPAKREGGRQALAIKTSSKQGYSGLIELMVGVDEEGKVIDFQVLSHMETPGLGSKISDRRFIDQFVGKGLSDFSFMVAKDGGEVDAISGATISSRAVAEAIEKALKGQEELR